MKIHTPRAFLPVFLLLALLVATGCASKDSDASTPSAAESPSPTAPATATTPPSTQPIPPSIQGVLDRVAELRELPAPPTLGIEFVSRSDLPALLDSLITDEDRAWFAETTRLYRLLGHFSNTQDYESIYRSFGGVAVLGLYSPPQKTLWVVHDDGEQIDLDNLPRALEETLAHELLHAIQDYNFDLEHADADFKDNLDISFTWTSVLEGDAVTHEQRYTQKYLALPSGAATVIPASALQIGDVPPSIIRELYFPYTNGAQWVQAAREAKGTAQIDEWIKNPPAGSAFILHPELLESGWQPETVALPDLAPALGSGWQRESGGQFGEFNLRNYLQLRLRALQALNAAQGWGGDHYDVYANGDEGVAAFRIRFTSPEDAAEFVDTHAAFLEAARATITTEGDRTFAAYPDGDVVATVPAAGSDVLFTIATSQDLAAKALDALLNG